jgi:hypothetical protein
VDSAFSTYEFDRPWRRATVVAGSVAVVEFVVLVTIAAFVFGRPLAHDLSHALRSNVTPRHAAALAHVRTPPAPTHRAAAAPVVATRAPGTMKVLVLNGNGRNGAAAAAATGLRRLGYRIAAVGNAARQNYPTTLVMYAPGFRAEGLRLARSLGVRAVGPLDGVRTSALAGGQLAVVLGA